jgi:hypothetical protein
MAVYFRNPPRKISCYSFSQGFREFGYDYTGWCGVELLHCQDLEEGVLVLDR